MLRFAAGLFATFFLSACATVAGGPRLSHADVRRIADAEVRRIKNVDPRQYEISAPNYIPKGDYWSVTYHSKTNKRRSFTVRVSDTIQKASINETDAGVFEGALTEKPDNH